MPCWRPLRGHRYPPTSKLKVRKYRIGEGVDAYLNELRRLGRISEASPMSIKLDFLTGMPRDVADRLKSTPGIHRQPMHKILSSARAMVRTHEQRIGATVAVASVMPDNDIEATEAEAGAVAQVGPKEAVLSAAYLISFENVRTSATELVSERKGLVHKRRIKPELERCG